MRVEILDYTHEVINDWDKIVFLVETDCPECKKPWQHEEYSQMPIACMALALCPDCDPGESMTIVGNNKIWK